jgi:hypothetical protein
MTTDLERFKQRLETAITQATTPRQRLARTVLLVVVNGEIRRAIAAQRPAPGRNGRNVR